MQPERVLQDTGQGMLVDGGAVCLGCVKERRKCTFGHRTAWVLGLAGCGVRDFRQEWGVMDVVIRTWLVEVAHLFDSNLGAMQPNNA